jgi:hypothetical protein
MNSKTWRRRRFRLIGSSLVAFNDVTKRATATIDLKKAVGFEDHQERESTSRRHDEDDALYGVERSFRLLFPTEQIITFFADSDEEKARWYVFSDHLRIDYLYVAYHFPPQA